MINIFQKIGIASSNLSEAINHKNQLKRKYSFVDIDEFGLENVDSIIALGGDGLMLHLLHKYGSPEIPVYGINYGTFGFLMNNDRDSDILQLMADSKEEILHPLKMKITDVNGNKLEFFAINEVSLLRQSNQTSKIEVTINDKVRIKNLQADGILVATPAGSTAYNRSVGGPIIPLSASMLAITPISPFSPRHWKGALLPMNSKIKFKILNNVKRPVSATADFNEVRDVLEVEVTEFKEMKFRILFDKDHSLEERIIREQFL